MKLTFKEINLHWAWLIPFLLLLMALVGMRLDMDGFWYDEVFTVRNAAGAGYGPLSLAEQYAQIQADDPYQAIGYPFTVTAWGYLVGWSEFALRVSSLLFTLIGMALTYRLGRDVTQSSWTGWLAAIVFGFSTFTVHYSHELRAFTFVTIFSALLLWAYWRILTRPTRMAYVWFCVGGIGLLYAHYYAAMLLIALGAYHLLFVKKDGQWWLVPLCGLLMGVAFLPQLPAFLEGFTRFDAANVEESPMSILDVLDSLLYYISNGLNLLALAVMLVGIALSFLQKSQLRMVVGIALLATSVLIISNELLDILEPTRLRYAIFLWSPFAVWIAAALMFISHSLLTLIRAPQFKIPILLLIPTLWFGNALIANTTVGFNESIEGTETPRLRTITNALSAEGAAGDLFAFYNGTSQQAWYIQDTLTYSTWNIPMPTLTTASLFDINQSTVDWAQAQIRDADRIWYGANRSFGLNQVHDDFQALLADQGFTQCDTLIMTDDLSLELLARSDVFCDEGRVAQFGGFTLTDYKIETSASDVRVQLGWRLADTVPPDTYSLSIQFIDSTGEVALTQDTGIPYDRFVPMTLSLDTSDLDAGEYEVHLVVYAWQTGERLTVDGADSRLLETISLE